MSGYWTDTKLLHAMSALAPYLGAFTLTFILISILFAAKYIIAAMRPKYPGPLLAKITQWWLRWHELRNTREKFIQTMHERYGPLVQITPNHISVNSAAGVRDIFAVARRLDRPAPVPLLHMYGSENLVSTQSGELHLERRRPLRAVYSARAVEGEEMLGVFKALLRRLVVFVDAEIDQGRAVDVDRLSRWFAADLMSHVVYGSENSLNVLGDEGQRIEFKRDLEWQDERLLTLSSLLMLWYPNVALWWRRVGVAPAAIRARVPDSLLMDTKGRKVLQSELSRNKDARANQSDGLMKILVRDFRDRGASSAIPDTDYILSEALDHFWAGITTTAEALSATIFQLSHPQNKGRQVRLRNDLRHAGLEPGCEISLAAVKEVPYLDFVIKETLRYSPPVSFSMERKVTAEEGLNVLGYQIPPGMEVSTQPYSVHRNLEVFPDPEAWRPERWDADDDRSRCMKRHHFAFSSGPRMCIGMNIAMTEMRLLLAQLYSVYETKLSSKWLLEDGEVRGEHERNNLWPAKKFLPISFRKLE